jgi:hypothetical protein
MPKYSIDSPPEPNEVGEELSRMELGVQLFDCRYVQTGDTCLSIAIAAGHMFGLDMDADDIYEALSRIAEYQLGWRTDDIRTRPNSTGVYLARRQAPDKLGTHLYLKVGEVDYNFGAGDKDGFTDVDMIPLSVM